MMAHGSSGNIALNGALLVNGTIGAGKLSASSVVALNVVTGSLTSDKFDTTVINVGGGGSKPGKFAVFNAAGSQIGFIGVESGNDGAWFKTMRVGGSSYANGILRADASGNVSMDGATFTLTLNGVTTEIANLLDAAVYVGLRIKQASAPGTKTVISPNSVVISDNSGWTPVTISNSGTSGFLDITESTSSRAFTVIPGSSLVNLNGMNLDATGYINSNSHFEVSGVRVVGPRKSAIGSASTSHSAGGGGTVDTALNNLGTIINAIVNRLGATSGHGMTSD
jgi:hypothetical protein